MILITLDIDWASDFTIKKVDEILKEKNIKATWFVTHKSAYLKNLSKNRNYELGIHPNFLSNTTQGKTPKEILKKLKKLLQVQFLFELIHCIKILIYFLYTRIME